MRNMPDFPGGTLAFLLLLALVALAVVRVEVKAPEIVIWETDTEEGDIDE